MSEVNFEGLFQGANLAGAQIIVENKGEVCYHKIVGGTSEEKPEEKGQTIVQPFIPSELRFFGQTVFGSEDKQQALIALLRDVITGIDISSGRDWMTVYAGWRYFRGELAVKNGYTDFFSDIEHLLPGVLTQIAEGEEGEKRFHKYTVLLGREADAWYMDDGKLPRMNEITMWKDRFSGDKNRYERNCRVIIDVFKRLKLIGG